ncbi:PIN domain-containing protein [Kitasatospora sp. KL5]|uniref:PIN domain-containing protein n=1 Tax=Kitasatospora sp. KL5 TaxID=3425125 RepID=UPI003D6F301F
MIVLDTNQLQHAAFPHGAVLGMVRKIAELSGQVLAIPEMVAVEDVAHHQHKVELALTAARKALATLDEAFGASLAQKVTWLSGELAAQKRQEALENVFKILPTPAGAAQEALRREAHRLPPAEQAWEAEDGKRVKARGARDVTIWLTLLETARSGENVWFVSQDGDFGKGDFHPALRDEAMEALAKAESLRLLRGGIDQLLSELAQPASMPEAPAQILQADAVTQAVIDSLSSVSVFHRLLPAVAAEVVRWAGSFRSSEANVELEGTKRAEAYQVGNQTWISAQLQWRATKIYSYPQALHPSSPVAAGTLARWTSEVEFRFEATVLIEVLSDQAVSAEVMSTGPLSIVSVSDAMN